MRELSLFTGVGGGLLGTHGLLGWECVGAVEWEEYPCRVLRQRQIDGVLNDFPIWHMDIGEFNRRFAAGYTGLVDVITAGFPCQPFSLAGQQRGADDERNQWPATIECIRIVRPRYCLLENVPGLVSNGYLGTVLGDLAACGYDARWRVLSAAELGAPHKRDRLWIVADRRGSQRGAQAQPGQRDAGRPHAVPQGREQGADGLADVCQDVADNSENGRRSRRARGFDSGRQGKQEQPFQEPDATKSRRAGLAVRQGPAGKRTHASIARGDWWATEPDVGRVAHGVSFRVDRLKGLGNAQVPAVAAAAWLLLTEDLA